MSRIVRIVVPGIPHHVVQRGNRRQQVFFCKNDYFYYLRLLKKYGDQEGVAFWAYCLMPNHVHMTAVPQTAEGLTAVMAKANWKYALAINLRQEWRGCLWQGRFYSCPLDHPHLLVSTRYIEGNPVRANMIERAGDYPWSSARAHIQKTTDALIVESPLTEEIEDWESFLSQNDSEETIKRLRRHLSTGRPLGDEDFVERLEKISGRDLRKHKPGPKATRTKSNTSHQFEDAELSD